MSADGFWDAWPAKPASLYTSEPLSNQLGPRGRVTTFVYAQGLQLACYYWPAQQPRAVLQLNHGSGAYVMEFLKSQGVGRPQAYDGSWVERLNDAGISVAGHDMQGLGFSEGLHGRRGYFDSLDDIIADAVQFCRIIPEAKVLGFDAGLPVFIAGISLGGCIALNCIQQQASLYKGAVLLAPMVSLEKASRAGLNPILLPLAGLVSRLMPMLAVAAVNKNPLYPELQREFDEDPLNFPGNVRARAAAEYLRVTRIMLPRLSEITTPWICFHGKDDTLCDPNGSKQLLEASKAIDKELVTMPKMWHVLIKEPGNDKIIGRVVEWIHQRV